MLIKLYVHPGFPDSLMNFQRTQGSKAKRYQVRQLINFIDEHELDTG